MWLTLHKFDSDENGLLRYDHAYERRPLADVGPLAMRPSGGTPLRDALWTFGHAARVIIDDPDDPTERLLLVMITDGGENTSRQHEWPEVRELIQGLEGAQCETIWLGTTAALMEARVEMATFKQAGASLGYAATHQGAHFAVTAMSGTVGAVRSGGLAREALANYASVDGETTFAATDLTAEYLAKLKTARAATKA
jgi:hypothetical protein